MKSLGLWLSILWVVALTRHASAEGELETGSEREKRLISLFSVVHFKNKECTATSGLTGTCYSSTECSDNGGSASGNCAAGFGVCCVVKIAACGGTITRNSTYIQNEDYPSTFTSTAATCTYTVNYCNTNICQLRLDFTNLVLATTSGAVSSNYLYVNGPTDQDPPYISGTNTGYHMYVETAASTTTTPIVLTTASTTTAQSWQIKVSQIECDALWRAPEGCTQFFTTASGTIYSYGYPNELQSQEMTACVRGNANRCQIDYSIAGTDSDSPDTFEVGATTANSETEDCTTSALHINQCQVGTTEATVAADGVEGCSGFFCNEIFSSRNDQTISGVVSQSGPPFQITHTSATSALSTVGFKLNYIQVGNCN